MWEQIVTVADNECSEKDRRLVGSPKETGIGIGEGSQQQHLAQRIVADCDAKRATVQLGRRKNCIHTNHSVTLNFSAGSP